MIVVVVPITRITWACIVLIVLRTLSAVAAAGETCEAVLEAAFAKSGSPGAIVSWQIGDAPPRTVCLGLSDVDAKRPRPCSSADHFRIGSLSKMFVGTAALILAGEKKLSLDDPIAGYTERLPNAGRITPRHLGSHRSGLFNPIESRSVKRRMAEDPKRWWPTEDLLEASRAAAPYFEPGQDFHYSNVNTVVLALAIENASGQPWEEVVRERVLVPLGLKNTSIPRDNAIPVPFAHGYAFGTEAGPFFHRGDVRIDVSETSPSWWGAAGSMISTIDDLRSAVKPLASGRLLTPAMRAELHHWRETDEGEYGFHLQRIRSQAIGHTGDVPGYQTCMYYLPDHDLRVAVMTNVYGYSIRRSPADDLFRALVDEGLRLPSTSTSTSTRSPPSR